jgi:hypothetical protein
MKPDWEKFYTLVNEWHKLDKEMASLPEFNDSEDFAVVFQPFTLNYIIPLDSKGITDYSYLSYDCYHLSQRGQARSIFI